MCLTMLAMRNFGVWFNQHFGHSPGEEALCCPGCRAAVGLEFVEFNLARRDTIIIAVNRHIQILAIIWIKPFKCAESRFEISAWGFKRLFNDEDRDAAIVMRQNSEQRLRWSLTVGPAAYKTCSTSLSDRTPDSRVWSDLSGVYQGSLKAADPQHFWPLFNAKLISTLFLI